MLKVISHTHTYTHTHQMSESINQYFFCMFMQIELRKTLKEGKGVSFTLKVPTGSVVFARVTASVGCACVCVIVCLCVCIRVYVYMCVCGVTVGKHRGANGTPAPDTWAGSRGKGGETTPVHAARSLPAPVTWMSDSGCELLRRGWRWALRRPVPLLRPVACSSFIPPAGTGARQQGGHVPPVKNKL